MYNKYTSNDMCCRKTHLYLKTNQLLSSNQVLLPALSWMAFATSPHLKTVFHPGHSVLTQKKQNTFKSYLWKSQGCLPLCKGLTWIKDLQRGSAVLNMKCMKAQHIKQSPVPKSSELSVFFGLAQIHFTWLLL